MSVLVLRKIARLGKYATNLNAASSLSADLDGEYLTVAEAVISLPS
jgi:hypothetical protein